jgi:tetratricopeptide (TPR) repeat protein
MIVNKVKAFVSRTLSHSLIVSALMVMPVVAASVVGVIAPEQAWLKTGTVHAQGLIQPAAEPPAPRRIPGVSQDLIRRLTEVQSYLEPDPDEHPDREPDLDRAMQLMQRITRDMDRYNSFEKAQIHQYLAQIYFARDQTDRLIESFETIVAQSPEIPAGLEAGAHQTLGQLYAQEERFEDALASYRRWAGLVTRIDSEQYYMLSFLFYQLDNLDRAIAHVNEAVRQAESRGRVPQENWLVMQRALYFEKEDHEALLEVLKKLVRHYPKLSYWEQLSSMYGILERENDRLHSLEALYLMGGVERERMLIALAAMFLERDVPYKAAKILHQGIYEDESIEPTADNLEMLANAWSLARESRRSLVEIERAAAKSDKGDLYARLSAIYTLNERFQDAIEAGHQALERGVSRSDQVYMRIGTAHVSLEQFDEAIEALEQAAKDKRSQEMAEQWIGYAKREKERKERQKREEEEAAQPVEAPAFPDEPTAQPAG